MKRGLFSLFLLLLIGMLGGCALLDGKVASPVPGEHRGKDRSGQEIKADAEAWADEERERIAADARRFAIEASELEAKYRGKIGPEAEARIQATLEKAAAAIAEADAEREDGLALLNEVGQAVAGSGLPGSTIVGGVLGGVGTLLGSFWLGKRAGQKPAEQIAQGVEQLKHAVPEIKAAFERPEVKAVLRLAQSSTARRVVDRVQTRAASRKGAA